MRSRWRGLVHNIGFLSVNFFVRRRRSCPWFLGLLRTHIVPQIGNPRLVRWAVCSQTLSLIWREARSCSCCRTFVCLPTRKWCYVGRISSLSWFPYFSKCLCVDYLDKPPTSVADHRGNLTHFIQAWAFTHPVLRWCFFNCKLFKY